MSFVWWALGVSGLAVGSETLNVTVSMFAGAEAQASKTKS